MGTRAATCPALSVQIAQLQAAIAEGIESGVAEDFSMEAIQADLDKR